MTLWTDLFSVGAMLGGAILIVGLLAIWISRLHPGGGGGEKELDEVTDLVVAADRG